MKKIFAAALVTLAMVGTAIAGTNYKLAINAPSARVSSRSLATITVQPTDGYHLNLEYPTKVTINAPAGVTVEKSKMAAGDATRLDKDAAQFDVAFVSAEKGRKAFTGEIKFAVCTETTCDPKVQALAFEVDVQ
jgi:hypothetical protein